MQADSKISKLKFFGIIERPQAISALSLPNKKNCSVNILMFFYKAVKLMSIFMVNLRQCFVESLIFRKLKLELWKKTRKCHCSCYKFLFV